jgi:pimeloyl-ACP methyl ester carboxylesterase
MKRTARSAAGLSLEVLEGGSASPTLLFLHGFFGASPEHAVLARLAAERHVVAPSFPGFGRSELPLWLDTVSDIAYVILELLDNMRLDRVDMVGCSIGAWLAAEIATKSPTSIRKMVLSSPIGIKVGPTDRLDIPDVFAMSKERLDELMFDDPKKAVDPATLSDEDLAISVRNRETVALLTWEPYMHNPKLKQRLRRVVADTLVLRGGRDGLVSADYAAKFSELLPKSRVDVISGAGHLPELERPDTFASKVSAFLQT